MEKKKKIALSQKKLALVVADNQKSVLWGAIFLLKKLCQHNYQFEARDDCFIGSSRTLKELHLLNYDLIIIADPNNKFTDVRDFLIKHYKKEIKWLPSRQIKFTRLSEIRLYVGDRNIVWGESILNGFVPKSKAQQKILDIQNSLFFLDNKHKDLYKPLILKRLEKIIKLFKLKKTLGEAEPKMLNSLLKEFIFELTNQKDSPLITSALAEQRKIEENKKALSKKQIKHDFIGSIKVVETLKGSLIDKSEVYQKALRKNNGIALLIKNDEYELCLRKNIAEKFQNEIPAIRRINGCRFIVDKKFLFSESEVI